MGVERVREHGDGRVLSHVGVYEGGDGRGVVWWQMCRGREDYHAERSSGFRGAVTCFGCDASKAPSLHSHKLSTACWLVIGR